MPDEARWRLSGWFDPWRAATVEQRRTGLLAAGSAVVGLAVAATCVVAAGPWDSGQRTAERQRAASGAHPGDDGRPGPDPARAPGASPVLAPLGAPLASPSPDTGERSVPVPTGPGLADALEPLLRDDALGPLRAGAVVDVATGRQLYGAKAGTGAIPASTIKIATGVAALSALGPGHRLTTRVTATPNAPGRIVLVGGGDPTLTARATRGPDGSHPASLRQLADQTARALRARGEHTVRLDYDTSLYTGTSRHPILPNENLAPVTALMVDEGRRDDSDRGPADRVKDPAAEAARAFARLLRDRGVKVTGDPRPAGDKGGAEDGKGGADGPGRTLASVRSQPLSTLVERMLTYSDNDIAEALTRHTARATGHPASFAGGRAAVTARLKRLGLPVAGAHLADGSGLDRADKVSAGLLAQLLARAAGPDQPALRPVLTGLPVAGFTGTLRDRYGEESVGRGVVRAKTGTLFGVNTLAGTVVDADGRLLTFAFLTNGSTDPAAAQRVLDRLASAVANCGCR
ncbi:D-alanyl-D-alanine carboxypeptidase/D-alanyl-D-alanine-endopeptidase [Streptomyces buecherae]|uniref:D-alanyl-D-alanine carboxypeptidase/D-alanyl-D-alanine-endopeptidase n=1 Tax=Streptomyces buecherae TaxID=2763006 RepID=A0A7H8N8E4_9ACTN|nr:D-alanyl-D-alanine carboxypeptidase/D-alanyl-D-alanine-endopeptidase [Streptomyces buecherae]QKW50771.1 D-alanyl-D-alanine carboxypeptidase/D-alanyl-D-alanine-endopeptidase [Streptomyces buecherae]